MCPFRKRGEGEGKGDDDRSQEADDLIGPRDGVAQQAQQDVGAGQQHHDDDRGAGQGVEAGADPGDFFGYP